jgi:hypothetical protein
VDEETYELVYPDGPVNAESLLTDPTGRLYVASKDVFGGALYAAPQTLAPDGPNRLRELGPVLPIATDAAFFPDGRHLVVRNYSRAAVYSFPGLVEVGSFPLPDQQQGEGVVVDSDGSLLVTSEGQHAPVLRFQLPADVRRAMRVTAASPSPSSSSGSADAESRPGEQLPEAEQTERGWWPWGLTAGIALGGLVVLILSLRPR